MAVRLIEDTGYSAFKDAFEQGIICPGNAVSVRYDKSVLHYDVRLDGGLSLYGEDSRPPEEVIGGREWYTHVLVSGPAETCQV